MPAEIPQGDLARTKSIEPNTDWPNEVQLRLVWVVDGRQRIRSKTISAEEFFGRGGAPLSGELLIQHIERMRRRGAPEASPKKAARDGKR